MTFAVTIDEKKTVLIDISRQKENVVFISTIINTNYSLIKYILTLTRDSPITMNKDGYVCIKRENGTTTSLQRLIMEFYSKYDENLKNILNSENVKKRKKMDVDHINANKLDNRIQNFQILTHNDNLLKSQKKIFQITIENKYLIKLDKCVREMEQYKKDENNLKVKGSKFSKYLKSIGNKNIDEISYLYLYSNYNDLISVSRDDWLDLNKLQNYISEECRKKLILLYNYRNYKYVCKILNNNIKILQFYRNRYQNIDLILNKYSILNNNMELDLIDNKSNFYDYEYIENKIVSKNVLYDLYEIVLYDKKYTIKDGNILSRIDVSMDLDKLGKYNCIRIMYMLGLLKREKSDKRMYFMSIPIYTDDLMKEINRKAKRILELVGKYNCIRIMYMLGLLKREKSDKRMYFMSIPIYTDDLMKEINRKAKRILELEWKKVRFFMVIEEFGEEVAKEVYKERYKYLKGIYTKYSLNAKKDIMDFLSADEQIKRLGFITVNEIFEAIQYKNELRKNKGEKFNFISDKFESFIRDLLNYNSDTKKLMNKLGLKYTTINKKIIQNIKEYQKSNGLKSEVVGNLKSKSKAIVLEKLI